MAESPLTFTISCCVGCRVRPSRRQQRHKHSTHRLSPITRLQCQRMRALQQLQTWHTGSRWKGYSRRQMLQRAVHRGKLGVPAAAAPWGVFIPCRHPAQRSCEDVSRSCTLIFELCRVLVSFTSHISSGQVFVTFSDCRRVHMYEHPSAHLVIRTMLILRAYAWYSPACGPPCFE
jgi:hypothetical protein